jgi:hypothetical protein
MAQQELRGLCNSVPTQNVTFPARQFTANGQRRSFLMLRATDDPAAQDRLRD